MTHWPLYDFLDDASRYALELAWATAKDEELARDGNRAPEEEAEGIEATAEGEGDLPAVRSTDGASAGVPSLSP